MLAQSNPLRNSQLFENAGLLKMSSLKKVKTTKELLADIQNRKLGSATPSPTLLPSQSQPLPSPSSGSEASMQSVSNSDMRSTSATPLSSSTIAQLTPDRNTSSSINALGKKPPEVDGSSKFKKIEVVDDNDSASSDYNSGSDSDTTAQGENTVAFSGAVEGKIKIEDSASRAQPSQQTETGKEKPSKPIEEEIKDLLNSLPPIDPSKIKLSDDDNVECKCELREIKPEEVGANNTDTNKDIVVVNDGNSKSNLDMKPIKVGVNKMKAVNNAAAFPRGNVPSSAAQSSHSNMASEEKPQKPFKSIFDLDFDEEDDPLRSYVEAAKYGLNSKKNDTEISITTGNDVESNKLLDINSLKADDDIDEDEKIISIPVVVPLNQDDNFTPSNGWDNMGMTTAQQQQKQEELQLQTFPSYELIEDPNCLAKKRYETEPNCVTKYHINALHNCYIANINGNWDNSEPKDSDAEGIAVSAVKAIDLDEDLIKRYDLHERVVPQYNSIIMDKIPKDLSHVQFTANYFKIKKKKLQQLKKSKKTHKFQLKNECSSSIENDKNDILSSESKIVNNNLVNISNVEKDGNSTDDKINIGLEDNDCTENISNDISLHDNEKPKKSKLLKNNDNLNMNFRNEKENNSSYNKNNSRNDKDNDNNRNVSITIHSNNNVVDENKKSDLVIRDSNSMLSNITTKSSETTNKTINVDGTSLSMGVDDNAIDPDAPIIVSNDSSNSNCHNNSASKCKNDYEYSVCNEKEDDDDVQVIEEDNVECHVKDEKDGHDGDDEEDEEHEIVNSMPNKITIKIKKNFAISIPNQSNCDTENEDNTKSKNNKQKRRKRSKKRRLSTFEMSAKSSSSSSSSSTSSSSSSSNSSDDKEDNENSNGDISLSYNCANNNKEYINKRKRKHKKHHKHMNDENNIEIVVSDESNQLPEENNGLLKSINNLSEENRTGLRYSSETNQMQQFKEWHEVCQIRSYNDELLTILPYVVID